MSLAARIILCLAGLAGATGVGLAAMASHVAGGAMLALAAQFLILHAAAALGAVALAERRQGLAAVAVMAASGAMLAGAGLFSGDLALRALKDTKLLWGTAPFGGTVMILGWLALAAGALFGRRD